MPKVVGERRITPGLIRPTRYGLTGSKPSLGLPRTSKSHGGLEIDDHLEFGRITVAKHPCVEAGGIAIYASQFGPLTTG